MGRILRVLALVAVSVLAAVATGGGVHATGSHVHAATATAVDPCGPLASIAVGGVKECTHGGDPAAPNPPALRVSVAAAGIPAPCPGNGRNGRRVYVLLGVPKNTKEPDLHAARSRIREAISLADQNLDAQSAEAGQHYRFYCADDTVVTVDRVTLPPIGADRVYTFGNVANGLSKAGYSVGRAIYATFVANIDCCYAYGGQGTLATDDQPDPVTNVNNAAFPRYAMIRLAAGYAASGLAFVFQHETGHNMGAVQDSAPHTSGAGHCYETYDIMCYNDGGPYFSGGSLVNTCPTYSPVGMYWFDCGEDDYYSAEPASGTYLTDHWNLADSKWLTPVGANGS